MKAWARPSLWSVFGTAAAMVAAVLAVSPVGGAATLFLGGTIALFMCREQLALPQKLVFVAIGYGLVSFVVGCAIWNTAPPVDAVAYVKAGQTLAAQHLTNTEGVSDVVLVDGKNGYVFLLGVLFVIFGPSPFVAAAANGASMAWIVALTFLSARALGVRRPMIAPYALVLFPGLLVWAAPPLREAFVLLCISIIMYAGICVSRNPRRRADWLALLAALVALVYLRGPLVLALAPATAIGATLAARGASRLSISTLAALTGGAGYLSSRSAIAGVLGRVDQQSVQTSFEELSRSRSGFTSANGPAGLAEAALRVLAGPFPWERAAAGIALVEAPLWLFMTLIAVRGGRRLGRLSAIPVALVLVQTLVISLSVGNYGSLLRTRLGLIPCLVVLVAAGWGQRDHEVVCRKALERA